VEKGPQNHHYWKSNGVVKHFIFLLFLLKKSADGERERAGSECGTMLGQQNRSIKRKKLVAGEGYVVHTRSSSLYLISGTGVRNRSHRITP
jgi:hypothetical protein